MTAEGGWMSWPIVILIFSVEVVVIGIFVGWAWRAGKVAGRKK